MLTREEIKKIRSSEASFIDRIKGENSPVNMDLLKILSGIVDRQGGLNLRVPAIILSERDIPPTTYQHDSKHSAYSSRFHTAIRTLAPFEGLKVINFEEAYKLVFGDNTKREALSFSDNLRLGEPTFLYRALEGLSKYLGEHAEVKMIKQINFQKLYLELSSISRRGNDGEAVQ